LIRTDHLSANASYELTDHLTIALSGRASIVNPVASGALSGLSRDTKFFNLGPQINWQVDEYWSVETGYTYSRRELEGEDQSGQSHAVRFMITYLPPKFSASR
jgi:outer membrane scaffolding protein for murein synthesis (MipA/OmpV family)